MVDFGLAQRVPAARPPLTDSWSSQTELSAPSVAATLESETTDDAPKQVITSKKLIIMMNPGVLLLQKVVMKVTLAAIEAVCPLVGSSKLGKC